MKCPKCGAEMREKTGRYGRFLGCSNWPRCNGARDLEPTDNSTPTKPTRRRAGLRVRWPETITRISTETTTIVPVEHLPP